ncbi:MAG: nucleotidyl transferase AbiEii/AbiGii toxin family protein [Ginsengibacter sp.]
MLHLITIDSNTYSLLQEIFTIEIVKNNFALAGGTSLALQIGHRKSIDLDIFSLKPFDVKELEIILTTSTKFSFKYTGSNSRMLFGNINNIKSDFVQEPANLLEPFIVTDGVTYFSVKDIAAMKLHTICGRGKKKDFFDVYALLQLYSKETLLEWFTQKYDDNQLFFFWRSILYFDDAENDPDIEGFPPFTYNWNEIKKFITVTFS